MINKKYLNFQVIIIIKYKIKNQVIFLNINSKVLVDGSVRILIQ